MLPFSYTPHKPNSLQPSAFSLIPLPKRVGGHDFDVDVLLDPLDPVRIKLVRDAYLEPPGNFAMYLGESARPAGLAVFHTQQVEVAIGLDYLTDRMQRQRPRRSRQFAAQVVHLDLAPIAAFGRLGAHRDLARHGGKIGAVHEISAHRLDAGAHGGQVLSIGRRGNHDHADAGHFGTPVKIRMGLVLGANVAFGNDHPGFDLPVTQHRNDDPLAHTLTPLLHAHPLAAQRIYKGLAVAFEAVGNE